MIDVLTGIPNIHSLNEDLAKFENPNLFVIDIKGFRKYSDELQDFVLTKFSLALDSFADFHDMSCYHIYGDKFALVINTSFNQTLFESIIDNLYKFISAQNYNYESTMLKIEVNIGISLDSFDSLKKATEALNLAKEQNQFYATYSLFAITLLKDSEKNNFTDIKKAIKKKDTALLPTYSRYK